ncbi:MAG TPA: hypothetical protein PKB15_01955 [Acidimicrobiia bacterium]|nr:hypothetical protein [Acidimicrobiia bacterium]
MILVNQYQGTYRGRDNVLLDMKDVSKVVRLSFYLIIAVLFTIFSITSWIAGNRATDKKTQTKASEQCPYTQQELDDIRALYDQPIPKDQQRSFEDLQVSIDFDAIEALKGQCAVTALERAYELGMRSLRDLTECWPDCAVTEDYSPQRLTFAIKDRRMIHIQAG